MQTRLWYCFQSLNLKAMVDEWSESKKAGRYFFCPFIKRKAHLQVVKNLLLNPPPLPLLQASTSSQFTQELIWVHQEEWQKEWNNYGNTMTLVDAIYKQPSMTSHCFCHCPHKCGLQSSCLLHCSARAPLHAGLLTKMFDISSSTWVLKQWM